MKDLVDFLRPAVGRCLGAVFSSYDFDEAFFESVLATLLPIHADPDTDPDRFADEGRRRLRETPVVVLIDGYRARGGHRLPFDLLTMPPSVAFHPKLSLTLFDTHARLMIGSANLTEGGYGGNAELVAQMELDYSTDGAMLNDVRDLINACGVKGEAWQRFDAQLQLLVGTAGPRTKRRLLHSAQRPPLPQQLIALLPKKSKIVGVSLLLGVQPEDDPVADTQVLDAFLDALGKKPPPFELGLPWEGNPVSAPAEASTVAPEALVGQLCARMADEALEYVLPLREEKDALVCQVGSELRTLPKATVQEEMAALRFWPLSEVTGVGPVAAIERMLERVPVRFFVFAELHIAHGQVFRRSLHAKLIAIRTLEGKKKQTHLLVGAPNFERLAEEPNTVLDAALYEVRDGHLSLEHLSSELVPAPVDQLYLQNRPLPAPTPLRRPPLEEAIYDASTRSLLMLFAPGTRHVHVVYQIGDKELDLVKGEPRLREQVNDFALDRHSAELRVDVGEDSWLVPIAFRHLPELLCDEPSGFGALLEGGGQFWDFVDLLCGRHDVRPEEGDERVSPQRVFRAIGVLVSELQSSGSALGAFEVAYRGPTGLVRFAERWFADSETLLDPGEAWLYGQELARALGEMRFGRDAAARYKQSVIDAFLHGLRERLNARAPHTKALARFYRQEAP